MSLETSVKPKGLPGAVAAKVALLVDYQPGSIVSREILKETAGNVTLFAFDEGQSLSEQKASFDALVQVLEGEAEVVVAGTLHPVGSGDVILIPAGQFHALRALKRFKMILSMIRS